MTGIDYVTQHYNIDTHKIAIAGWSAGGYMSAWAIGHTNRFFTAIDGDGITDFVSYATTSDDTDFGLRYLGKNVWDAPQLYWQHSPLAFAKNIKTPLLIIHGEKDIRVPLSQGKELMTTLTLLNKPVKMVIAPNQGHVPSDAETFTQELEVIDKQLFFNTSGIATY